MIRKKLIEIQILLVRISEKKIYIGKIEPSKIFFFLDKHDFGTIDLAPEISIRLVFKRHNHLHMTIEMQFWRSKLPILSILEWKFSNIKKFWLSHLVVFYYFSR